MTKKKDKIIYCNAINKRNGKKCSRVATPGRRKCRQHGGKSPRGMDSPAFVHGRYSKALPKHISEKYIAALADTKLVELGNEIALVRALMQQRLKDIYSGHSDDAWLTLNNRFAQVTKVRQALKEGEWSDEILGDGGKAKKPQFTEADLDVALDQLGEIIRFGLQIATAFEKVAGMLEQLRRLVDSQVKQQQIQGQFVAVDDVFLMLSALVSILKEKVPQPEIIEAVVNDTKLLVGKKKGWEP